MSYLVTLLVALLGVTLCPAYLYEPDNVDTWMDDGMDFLQDIRLWKPIDTVDVNGGCCLPPEMQIFEGMMLAEAGPGRGRMGQPRVIIGNIKVSLSTKKNMTFSDVFLNSKGQVQHLQIYQDFNSGIQYKVDIDKGTCEKSKAEYSPFCVPAGAKVLGNVYFGSSSGANHINSTWYATTDKQKGYQAMVSLTSTGKQNECVPVTEVVYGFSKGVSYALTLSFMNFVPEVDPNVFNIPDVCKKASVLGPLQNPSGSTFFNW